MTVSRFLALVLAFFLGFLSCIGAIFGVGYYAYSRVSLDKLEEWGVVSVDEGQYILRALLEQHPGFSQLYAVVRSCEQFCAEFIFELFELLGHCRLRDVKALCSSRHIFLSCRLEKISQYAYLHMICPAFRSIYLSSIDILKKNN